MGGEVLVWVMHSRRATYEVNGPLDRRRDGDERDHVGFIRQGPVGQWPLDLYGRVTM